MIKYLHKVNVSMSKGQGWKGCTEGDIGANALFTAVEGLGISRSLTEAGGKCKSIRRDKLSICLSLSQLC